MISYKSKIFRNFQIEFYAYNYNCFCNRKKICPSNRIRTSDLRISVKIFVLQSSALPTELSRVHICKAFRKYYLQKELVLLVEGHILSLFFIKIWLHNFRDTSIGHHFSCDFHVRVYNSVVVEMVDWGPNKISYLF